MNKPRVDWSKPRNRKSIIDMDKVSIRFIMEQPPVDDDAPIKDIKGLLVVVNNNGEIVIILDDSEFLMVSKTANMADVTAAFILINKVTDWEKRNCDK